MQVSAYQAAASDVLKEILRDAEARLEAQLTTTLGADQRAMTFSGLLIASAGALIGVVLAVPNASAPYWLVAFVSAALLLAAGLAVYSAQPTRWEYVGNIPSHWLDDISSGRSLEACLAEMLEHYDTMILDNEAEIESAAIWMNRSMFVAVASLVIGLFGGLLVKIL